MQYLKLLLGEIKTTWSFYWKIKSFRTHFLFSLLLFAAVLHFSCMYLNVWEGRHGVHVIDPLLSRINPKNFSTAIFCIVYAALLISLFITAIHPKELVKAFQAYAILTLMRTIVIYFVPLEVPNGMIYLQDPISGFFLNNATHTVTKDLFFSGHISVMCLFIYFTENRVWKSILLIATPVLAALILWQHVHYTMDIIAAPFFAFASCRFIDIMNERWEYGVDNIHTSPRFEWYKKN